MKKLPLLVAILVWVMVSGCVSTARRVEAPASITAPAAEKLEVKANGGVELQAPSKICWSWSPPPAVEMAWEPKILYHLEVDRREDKISKNKLEYPLFLKPGKKNQLTFYVGPETGVRSLRHLDKEDFELKVSMDCNISEKAPPDKKKANTQMIKYYRRLRSSTPAIFTIVPISDAVGNLTFTVEYNGNIIHRIRVKAFVCKGDPTPEIQKKYRKPPDIEFFEADLENKGEGPDIIIKVEYNGKDGKLPITINPRVWSLREEFFEAFTEEFTKKCSTGKWLDREWKFKSGVTRDDLIGVVKAIYTDFGKIDQNNLKLQELYKKLGREVVLGDEAGRNERLKDEDKEKLLKDLKRNGRWLFKRIFIAGAEEELTTAMKIIDNVPPPLRIEIRTPDIYAPWQILYPDEGSTARAEKFWGFRYDLASTTNAFTYKKGSTPVCKYESPAEIVFVRYQGVDDVGEHAKLLEGAFKYAFGEQVERYCHSDVFLNKLGASQENIKLLFAYGHATSGTAVASNRILKKVDNDYQLQPGDFIRMFSDIDYNLTGEFEISPDFMFSHDDTRIGDFVVKGKTLKQIKDKINYKLKDFKPFPNPRLEVWVNSDPELVKDVAGAYFKFSDCEYLSPINIDEVEGHLTAQPIVILDACETATRGTGDMNNNGFVGAFARLGAGAVIGTECSILAPFGERFGEDLIDELFNFDQRFNVSQALRKVRKDHLDNFNNPLGLVFTLYGNPATQIVKGNPEVRIKKIRELDIQKVPNGKPNAAPPESPVVSPLPSSPLPRPRLSFYKTRAGL